MNGKYKAQIDSVLEYINQQTRKDWSTSASNAFNNATKRDILAKIACMSPRNFQLIFKAYLKEPFGVYIDRIRRELALQLIQEAKLTHAEIAERIGYANDTALYNVFKKKYQRTPSEYKTLISQNKKTTAYKKVEYKIQVLHSTPVIYLSYIGNYDDLSSAVFEKDSWDKLYDFATSQNILPETEEYFGICFDSIKFTDTDKCRFYACLSINHPIKTKVTDEIKHMTIPSSEYAVFTHIGAYEKLDSFYDIALLNIPSNYEFSNELIIERYINSPTDTQESELITELWIPVRKE